MFVKLSLLIKFWDRVLLFLIVCFLQSVKFAVQPSKTNEPATDADVEESAQQPGQPGQLEKQGNRKVTAAATATASAAARGASKGGVHASTEVRNLPPRSALKKPAGATSTSQHPHHHHHQQPQESQSEKELKKFGDSVGFGGEGAAGTGTGGEDDEDFASEASDNAVMSARPMAADLRLPKVRLALGNFSILSTEPLIL